MPSAIFITFFPGVKQLTEQQHRVLVGIAEGYETIALAAQIGLSPKTVEYHRVALYTALADEGVRQGNVADLVNYAISNDIVAIRYSEMKLTYQRALKLLGLTDFELKTDADYDRIMGVWRDQTTAARQVNNDTLAAELSQCKEVIKHKWMIVKSKVCPRCTQKKGTNSEFCTSCTTLLKGDQGEAKAAPDDAGDMYTVIDDIYIMPKSNGARGEGGVLTQALRKLVNIGDSFLTNKSPTSVKNASKNVGIITLCRKANPGERDKMKRRFRVWRTDGLKASEVNRAIKQRMDAKFKLEAAGQTVPQQAPEPPKAEEID